MLLFPNRINNTSRHLLNTNRNLYTLANVESQDKLIGRNVQRLRGDMSQKSLADAMKARGWKWSQPTVTSVEQGARPLKLGEADDLVDLFGLAGTHELTAPEPVMKTMALLKESVAIEDRLRTLFEQYFETQVALADAAEGARSQLDVAARWSVKTALLDTPIDVLGRFIEEQPLEGEYRRISNEEGEYYWTADQTWLRLRAFLKDTWPAPEARVEGYRG